jgi:hypothetical protein
MGPKEGTDTKTNWPTDCRSQNHLWYLLVTCYLYLWVQVTNRFTHAFRQSRDNLGPSSLHEHTHTHTHIYEYIYIYIYTTPWSESASVLYRPSDRRSSAKLVLNLRIECATWSAWRIPTAVFWAFYTGAATFSSKQLLNCTHEAERSPFQTHYFTENLVAPRIEPGPLDL